MGTTHALGARPLAESVVVYGLSWFGKRLGILLGQEFEFGDFLLHEGFAVALALDFHGFLDAFDFLVLPVGRFLSEFFAHETHDLGHLLDGQAILLVEIDGEFFAVRAGDLYANSRAVAYLDGIGGSHLESFTL